MTPPTARPSEDLTRLGTVSYLGEARPARTELPSPPPGAPPELPERQSCEHGAQILLFND
jgi:hypothetical protein